MLSRRLLQKVGFTKVGVRNLTDAVRIVEVGVRDVLHNVSGKVPVASKIDMINRLSESGLRSIEVTSFVSAKYAPRIADFAEVYVDMRKIPSVDYSAVVPNPEFLERVLELGIKEIVFLGTASEAYSHKKLSRSIANSLENFRVMRAICEERKVLTRALIACSFGCPYQGNVERSQVVEVAEALLKMGCYEVALCDTLGVANPKSVKLLLEQLRTMTGGDIWRFAMRCRDNSGLGMVNVYEGLNRGIRVFDSSIAGLRGYAPYPNSSSHVPTEDLVNFLHGEGVWTGVDLNKLIDAGHFISDEISMTNRSKLASRARQ